MWLRRVLEIGHHHVPTLAMAKQALSAAMRLGHSTMELCRAMAALRSRRLARRLQRSWTLAALGTLVLGLSACGAVKMAYNNGESLALLWANRYLDLDPNQDALARERVHAWFHWHRTTQLPEYALLAADIKKRVSTPVTASEVSALESQIQLRWLHAVQHALPDAADLALTLRPAQLIKMTAKFASNDEKYRSQWVDVSVSHRNDLRYQKMLNRIEYWYGTFSPEQRASVRRAVESQPVDARLWLAEREDREKELLGLLRRIAEQRPSRDEVIRLLGDYMARLNTSPDATRRAYIEALDQSNRELYVLVANLATVRQREHAALKLQSWIDDLNTSAKM